MSVLLGWIRTKPNYTRFNQGTRSNNTGETKYAISMEVVNAIKNAGITTHTQEAVIAKISQLETNHDEAHDHHTRRIICASVSSVMTQSGQNACIY